MDANSATGPVRVLNVIARLNMGGPAVHVALLTECLAPDRYRSHLVYGSLGPDEGSLEDLARRPGVSSSYVSSLSPRLRPSQDVRALIALIRVMRTFRPQIVHTHTAKAGMLGRLASLSIRQRPVLVHTYHGHVLEGYFGRAKAGVYRRIERQLARITDVLIGVSDATVRDLVRLGIAAPEKFAVVPLGLRLERFASPPTGTGDSLRRELRLQEGEVLITCVGRLVPIKCVDLAIRSVVRARHLGATVRLAIVGGGELQDELERLVARLEAQHFITFVGFREDMVEVAVASDIALLTSANEGTPVALIEAAAAGKPAVATDVGGVATVVVPGAGLLLASGDEEGIAEALVRLSRDADLRQVMGEQAQRHALDRFSLSRLLEDMDRMYRVLLAKRIAVGAIK